MLGTSHEGEDEGGESAEMGGSVLVGGSERRTEFRSKINEHGMALVERRGHIGLPHKTSWKGQVILPFCQSPPPGI